MKELSIEDKAKRYDEAIKVAKRNYDTIVQMDNDCTFAKEGIVNTFHHMFPELKESENERIRKWIIENIQETLDVDGFFEGQKTKAKNAIAWLEKQGEQKHVEWSEEDEKMRKTAISLLTHPTVIKNNEGARKGVVEWLEHLKPPYFCDTCKLKKSIQQGWKPSEEQMEAVRLAAEIGTANSSWAMGILKSMYQDLKKLKE